MNIESSLPTHCYNWSAHEYAEFIAHPLLLVLLRRGTQEHVHYFCHFTNAVKVQCS